MPRYRMRMFAVLTALFVVAGTLFVAPATAGTSVTWTRAKVIRWLDGDTVKTNRGTVRMVGIDTPEVGTCGAGAATRLAKRLAPAGSTVQLGNPRSVDNTDRYGRLLRYVDRATVDLGARQIKKGAKARYDSRDGYQRHPREAKYRRLDANNPNYRCGGGGGGGGGDNPWEVRANKPVSASNPDIDCGDIPSRYKPVRIYGTDYHRLDADGDGWGCDS
jgi:endonuclease YncB( thermonuclease family)